MEPYLTAKLNQSFPDPAQFKKLEDFTYAALAASTFKKVLSEVLGWIGQQKDIMDLLRKKEKGEIIDKFEIGKA